MHLLLPRLHPATTALLAVILVICELLGGSSDGGVHFALPPLAIAAGVGLGATAIGANIWGKVAAARNAKKGISNYLGSPEYAALNDLQQQAALRQKLKTSGLAPAAQRKITQQAGFDYKALVSKTEADTHSGSADPTQAAAKTAQVAKIAEGAADVATKSAGQVAKLSSDIGAQQTAGDVSLIQGGAAHRQAVETGKSAANTMGTQAITGGISDAASLGLNVLPQAMALGGGKRAAAGAIGEGIPEVGAGTNPPAGAVG